MAKANRTRRIPSAKDVMFETQAMQRHPQQHGHPRAWMTVLLVSAAALIILVMAFAALQLAAIAGM